MNTKHTRFNALMCAVVTISSVSSVLADGYRNPPPTAEGIAKSGVNAAFVDDASAISYNVANLALQTNASFVASFTFARTEDTYTPPPGGTSFESDGDWNVLPNIYFAMPVSDGFTLGLGITTPYGQGISWEGFENLLNPVGPSPVLTVPYEATATTLDITPAAAMKLRDNLTIGIGLDIYYSKLELKAVNISPSFPSPPTANSTGEGDAWGLGANAAITWLPVENQRAVLTFKSGVELDYKGDFELEGFPPYSGDFGTTIKYPNSVGLGYGIALSDKFQLEALVEWLQWSVNDSQTLVTGPLIPPTVVQNNWDDTFTLGFGGTWFATDGLAVRAGYAYLPSPIPDETITPLLVDADRHALSLGLGYTFGAHTIDAAYTFSLYTDRSSPLGSSSPGLYEVDSNLVGLTYSLSF